MLFYCCSHQSGEDAAPDTAVFVLGWTASGMGWAPVGAELGREWEKALCPFLASILTHPNKTIILTSLFEEEPRRRLSSKSWRCWPLLQLPASVTRVHSATGERGAGTMELMVGLHPAVGFG